MPSSRRRFLAVLGATGTAGLAGCSTVDDSIDWSSRSLGTETAPGGPHSWPMFHHDRYNSGGSDTTGPTGDVSQQWRRDDTLPDDGRDSTDQGPAVVDGTVFFGSGRHLYALSAADGADEWQYDAGDRVVSTPAVVDGTVFFGSGRSLYALSATDGTERWRYEISPSSPTVVDGTVYVCSDTTVVAVSTDDGTERWTAQTGTVEAPPAVADGTVYVGTGYVDPCDLGNRGCRGESPVENPDARSVVALSASDGAVQWRQKVGETLESAPTVADGSVYAAGGDSIYALAAADGAERWSTEIDGANGSPAVADGTVYVRTEGGDVYALSADDGTEEWGYEIPSGRSRRYTSPVVVDGTVYAVSRTEKDTAKYVHAWSATDGTEQWRFEVGPWMPAPAVVDGTVYLGPLALG